MVAAPRLELFQSGAPHEEALVAVGASPLGCRPGQAPLETEVLPRVVDPRSQPSPRAQQRLVRDLDRGLPGRGLPIEGEEPVAPEGVHDDVDRLPFNVEGVELTPGDAAPRVLAALAEGDQPQECLLGGSPALVVGRLEDPFGSGGQGAPVIPPSSWYAVRVNRSSSRRSKSSVRAYCRSGRAPG